MHAHDTSHALGTLPQDIKLNRAERRLSITWKDGVVSTFDTTDLRTSHFHAVIGRTREHLKQSLDAWLQDISAETISRDGFHDILTHVVDEVHTICSEVGVELLGQG